MLIELSRSITLQYLPTGLPIHNLQHSPIQKPTHKLTTTQNIPNLHINQLQKLPEYSIDTVFIDEE